MANEGNGDLPVPDLRTMEELCQPSLNSRGGLTASIAIQETNFRIKNDMIQQVQNSCQFHGLPGDDANKHLDKFLHVTQSIKVNGVTDEALLSLSSFLDTSCHHLSESSSSITSSSNTEIAALKAEMAEFNKNLIRVLQVNKQVKAVTLNYETCGGPHSFNDCPATVGNTQNIYAAGAYQGTLPGNTITNPKEELKGITTHSGTAYQGPTILTTSTSFPPVVEHETEATKDTVHPTNNGSTEDVQPLVVPTESPILNSEPVIAPIIEPVASPVSSGTLPSNTITNPKEDLKGITTRSDDAYQGPTIPSSSSSSSTLPKVVNRETEFMKINTASSSSIGTLPGNTFTNPKEELKGITTHSGTAYQGPTILTTSTSLPPVVERETEATKDAVHPTNNGSTEDVQPLVVPTESPILNSEPVIAPIIEPVASPAITFNLDQTSRYSANYNDVTANRIDVIDMSCKEYSQEVLGFSDVIASRNPTPYYDSIVSTTSLTLTPFKNSDFLLEEVDAFLALEDDPTSPEVDQSYVNTEGDILLLEAFLNDDPSLPPPNQGNYLPQVLKELKIYKAKTDKSSIDEPPEVELKDLPPHLEYAFLEGDDKLPVIIVKDLSVEEKIALITVLKSHKRAIAWKLTDMKGIDPEFFYLQNSHGGRLRTNGST
uniref:Reverse transcriptase domain-containing protein n=1 Tax=Tanacetum cinerariifolium TaxID=118510 RepID=A0A699I3C3_TANCI|nr:reverse transcriptase domain-containing protein [Tanacetum cinerariifolium]